jgi:hypothetical protein
MSFNQYENIFLSDAIADLNTQLKELSPYKNLFRNGQIGLGNGVRFVELPDGRLTVKNPETGKIDPDVEPVEYKSLIPEAPDMATSVRIYLGTSCLAGDWL